MQMVTPRAWAPLTAALDAGCNAFLTGDKDLWHITEIGVLVLDDLTA